MDHEADNSQQIQKEEKDVVSDVATVIYDLCGPGEWMAMSKLHSELLEHYSGVSLERSWSLNPQSKKL